MEIDLLKDARYGCNLTTGFICTDTLFIIIPAFYPYIILLNIREYNKFFTVIQNKNIYVILISAVFKIVIQRFDNTVESKNRRKSDV